MKLRHLVAVAISILMLSACSVPAPKYPPIKTSIAVPDMNDPRTVTILTTTERDDFEKYTRYIGPPLAENSLNPCYLFIRFFKYDDGKELYQIYIEDSYDSYKGNDWRSYDRAYDSSGNSLNITLIDKQLEILGRDFIHHEILGLNVTRAYLEGSQQSGLKFKIAGSGGEKILSIPSGYIKGFLSVENESQ